MKRAGILFCFALCLSLIFLQGCTADNGNEESTSSTGNEPTNVICTTGYLLVENGIPREISDVEYAALINTKDTQTEPDLSQQFKRESISFPGSITYSFPSFFYAFSPTEITTSYADQYTRVSYIFEGASSFSGYSGSYTRTVTESGGVTVSEDMLDAIDGKVAASYSLSTSAAPAAGTSIGATFFPTGNDQYACICFTPKLTTVTGDLYDYQNYQGGITLLSVTSDIVIAYPHQNSNGLLDGIYQVVESDDVNALGDLA
jgi:hypothetical protein